MDSARSEQQETDRAFVERQWQRAEACPHGYSDQDPLWCISLGGRMFTKANVPHPDAATEDEAWTAAADFTRDRIEEIRQIEEEVQEMEIVRGSPSDWYSWVNDGPWVADDGVAPHIQRYARRSRTLARLQRELDRLKGDMKPAAAAQEQEGTK